MRAVSGRDRRNADNLAIALAAELDRTRAQGEQGVILATANAVARVEVGAALTNEDLTSVDQLAAVALHAEALRVGVAAVTGGTKALLMCHQLLLSARGNVGFRRSR